MARAGAADAIAPRLQAGSLYERRKALDELMALAPQDPATVDVLIRLLRSRDAEEARNADFMQRVGRAIKATSSKTTWPPAQVESLTATLVHNDAYDARATDLTASIVAWVARDQAFPPKAIDDLTTVLWHRVDRNPQRTRNDNTRSHVVQALRNLQKRGRLPRAVVDAAVASLGSESNSGVRSEIVWLIGESARSQPASEAMVRALAQALQRDERPTVRAHAARALSGIGEQRGYAQGVVRALQQAAAGDPDQAVRRAALSGLMAAATAQPASAPALSPAAMGLLLQAAAADSSAAMRLQVVQALRKTYATRAPDLPARKVLLERLASESDATVRGLIAVTLQEIHTREPFGAQVIEPLIALATDDPSAQVRQAIRRMIPAPPAERDFGDWLNSTRSMGLSPADAATAVAVPDIPARSDSADDAALRARLAAQYAKGLSGERPAAVRKEILEGLFALSLSQPLPQSAVDALARSLVSDADAKLRLLTAAVLLHNGLQHRRDSAPFLPALGDADARVHDYAAFALVELAAEGGDVLPGLLAFARDASAHRQVRVYSLRRLAHWRRAGRPLPESVQAALLALTAAPDVELRAQAWHALQQFGAGAEQWRRAAADDDLGIRRMAWRELESRGVVKPLSAKWRDPKERLQLIAVGLLGTTVAAVLGGAAAFLWRLLLWWQGARQRWGRMLAAQLVWLVAALAAVALDAGIVFVAALSHHGMSEKDLTLVNSLFGAILAGYAALALLGWKLLPVRSVAAQSTS